MNIRRLRPGPGWRCLGGPVWEHECGVRAHVGGMCGIHGAKLVGGCSFLSTTIVIGSQWPESQRLDRCIAMSGGNRKRGVLVWAMMVWRDKSGLSI